MNRISTETDGEANGGPTGTDGTIDSSPCASPKEIVGTQHASIVFRILWHF